MEVRIIKVRISFERPESLTIDLTPEQYEAAMDEYSWEEFYYLMEQELADHLWQHTVIDDIRDVD
jgi:hypothetical protein